MFAIIQDKQEFLPSQPLRDGRVESKSLHLGHAKHSCYDARDEFRVGYGRKVGQPHAIGILVEQIGGDLHRKPCLTHAAGTDYRKETVLTEESFRFLKIVLAAAKTCRLNREIVRPRVERRERRKFCLESV